MASTIDPLELTQRALAEFEDVSLAASARRAYRIAQLLGDAENAWQLSMALKPVGGSKVLKAMESKELWPDADYETVRALHAAQTEIFLEERTVGRVPEILADHVQPGSIISGSLDEMEETRAAFHAEVELQSDVQMRLIARSRATIQLQVIDRVRYRTFAFLTRAERQLTYGSINASIFERQQRRVDGYLAEHAPDVLDKINAAYRRAREGGAEDLSQALTSCRRVLKAVADLVYPARAPIDDGKGGKRIVGDNEYVNRLWQYLAVTGGGHTATRLTLAVLDDIGKRVDMLNEMTSKGVHADVSQAEVDQCVIQTYLLAGEVLERCAELGPR